MARSVPGGRGGSFALASPLESRLFAALAEQLPADHLVYHHAALTGRPPTVVVIVPALGVALLEVKDRPADALARVALAGPMPVPPPAHPVARLLAGLPSLGDSGVRHALLLPAIRRAELGTPRPGGVTLGEILGEAHLTADDLQDDLRGAIERLFPARLAAPLTRDDVDSVRALLFPELRFRWAGRVGVLDPEQDRLAHLPPEGHHLVCGGAGSGKTVTLLARARYLREQRPDWRILLLVCNRVAADLLREAVEPDERLEALHFHAWCWRSLDRAGLEIPPAGPIGERAKYWTDVIPELMLRAFQRNRLSARFEAILVDDAHDFPPSWLAVVVQALNPRPQSLFLAYDPCLAPAGWAAGVAAGGIRSPLHHELPASYRAQRQIITAAEALVRASAGGGTPLATPGPGHHEAHGPRGGFAPDIRRFKSAEEERQHVVAWIRQKLLGRPPSWFSASSAPRWRGWRPGWRTRASRAGSSAAARSPAPSGSRPSTGRAGWKPTSFCSCRPTSSRSSGRPRPASCCTPR